MLAFGTRALQTEVLMELRRRSVPCVNLGGTALNPVGALTAEALAPVLSAPGAALVLVEPEAADAAGLNTIAEVIQKSPHKPKLYVAAKAFNPFVLPMSLRLLKMEQIKEKARDFVASLPVGAPPAPAAPEKSEKAHKPAAQKPAAQEAAGQRQAPRPVFVGREEELAWMSEALGADGGPILVVGTPGIGKRWLVEHALGESKLSRLPDFTLGRGVGADALFGRIAAIAQDAGDDSLSTALKNVDSRPVPQELAELAAKALQNPALAGKVWVIFDLHRAQDRRDGSLHRMGRLELTLRELLLSTPALRLVLVSNQAVSFYREGDAQHLRVLKLAGIRGKELHQVFKAWHVEDTPRDRFGPISDRTLGHPLVVRALALEVAEGQDLDELLRAPRFLKLEELGDLDPLRRHIKRKVEALDDATRKALNAAAHLREPGTTAELQLLGLSRNDRINLLSMGLLEQTPALEDRKYYVHPLVREHLEFQDTSNFDVMEMLAGHFMELSRDKEKGRPQRLAWMQESHRLCVESRRGPRTFNLPYPDQDAIVDSIAGLMRRKLPRFDIARARLNESLKVDPKNTELLILDAELKGEEKAGAEAIAAAWARAAELAPTPELFHSEAGVHLDKNTRGKAVAALERGLQVFPGDARMCRRLANLYLKQNRVEDAVATLRRAMELEPMMPDAYGMLGEIYIGKGTAHWAEGTAFIEEALRLEPEHPVHLLRLAALRRAEGIVQPEDRNEKWAEATEKAKLVVQRDPESQRAHVFLCTMLLDQEGSDIDQAEWLAKKALKINETTEALVVRARVLVRRAAFEDAERLLDKAIKKEPSYHPAFAAMAELLMAQGKVFVAFENLKKARERSPKEAVERVLYEADMARLSVIIESGAASDLAKAGEAEGEAGAAAQDDGGRRDPGTTTLRRKHRRGGGGGGGGEPTTQEVEVTDAASDLSTQELDAPTQDADAPADEPAPEPADEPAEPESSEQA